jgi:hypothetical protein
MVEGILILKRLWTFLRGKLDYSLIDARLSSSAASGGGTRSSTSRAGLLQSKELLASERLVVDLGGGFNEILEVGAEEEITQVDKLAVTFILDIDDTPAVLSAADWLSVNDDVALRSNDSEWDHRADGVVVLEFFLVKLVSIKGIQADVVINELCADLE